MNVKIILRKDGMYDVYNGRTGEWWFSSNAAENVFVRLSQLAGLTITFTDETIK